MAATTIRRGQLVANIPTDLRLTAIRKRVERQGSRYGVRWNQIRRDRRDLLAEVDRLRDSNMKLQTALAQAAISSAGCPLCCMAIQRANKTALEQVQK